MKKLYYVIAAVSAIFWAIGFFVVKAGILIHLLLVPVALAFLVAYLKNRKKHIAFKPMQLSLR